MDVKWAKVTDDGSVLLVWKTSLGHSSDIKMKKYLELWHEVNNEAKAKRDPKLAGSAVKKLIEKLTQNNAKIALTKAAVKDPFIYQLELTEPKTS